ncbi:tyrosine-type recombinase/integrase [Cupriavidus campinensis]|uniref:Tyrosine-type recombinase/integrase n=1 Tax=Cupriavidus campinensis TaxID=151783 RepID=A0AAE9L356_9BURK|nr:site-specific integrase [Cupriavidus campinensis]URF05039.1 tyrosine-type recombinase/integrase [Cupriavidus campinensis]
MPSESHINFTKAALLAIPAPAKGRATYHDTKTPGLQLRVTETGVKTFSVFRRVKGGSPVRLTIGRFPDVSIEKARQQAMSHTAELAIGTDLAERQRKIRAVMTFADLFAEYMTRHSKIKKRTWQQDESQFKQYLSAPLGRKRLSEIGRKNIADVHSSITANGHAATANRVLALISSVFGWANSVDMWDQNPAVGIKKNAAKSRDRFIQGAELPNFFRAVQAEPNDCIRDFFLISLLTGARRANVLEMAWAELHLAEGAWRIPRTKNGEAQTVTLVKEAVEVLERRKKGSASLYVFPGSGDTGHLVEPKKGWHRIKVRMAGQALLQQLGEHLEWEEDALAQEIQRFLASTDAEKGLASLRDRTQDAGLVIPTQLLPDLRIHDLRRTLASWQVKTGATLAVVGKSLNHRSTATTAIYARLDHDPVRAAVMKATEEMLNVGQASANLEGILQRPKQAESQDEILIEPNS